MGAQGGSEWEHGCMPATDGGGHWTRAASDPPPTAAEHAALYRALSEHLERVCERLRSRGLALSDLDFYARGDWFGDRTEQLCADTAAFSEAPAALVEAVGEARGFLARGPWRRWRLVLPLRDLREGGVLMIYPEGVWAKRELAGADLENHLIRLVARDAAEREGREVVGRARLERLAPRLRSAVGSFLAAGDSAVILDTEVGEPGYQLVWILHRFPAGLGVDDLELRPESGYQEVLPVSDEGLIEDAFGDPHRARLLLVLWEVPRTGRRQLRLALGGRQTTLPLPE